MSTIIKKGYVMGVRKSLLFLIFSFCGNLFSMGDYQGVVTFLETKQIKNVNAQKSAKWDAMLRAMLRGDVETVKKLFSPFKSSLVKTKSGHSLLKIADYHNDSGKYKEVVDLLNLTKYKDKGSNSNAKKEDWDAILAAIGQGNFNVVKTFFEKGIFQNSLGTTRGKKPRTLISVAKYALEQHSGKGVKVVEKKTTYTGKAGKNEWQRYQTQKQSGWRPRYQNAKFSFTSLKGKSHDIIWFYDSSKAYYQFANFWPTPSLKIDGSTWKTTEHYFQANKFKFGSTAYNAVKNATGPMDAFKEAKSNKHKQSKLAGWDEKLDTKTWPKISVPPPLYVEDYYKDYLSQKYNNKVSYNTFKTGWENISFVERLKNQWQTTKVAIMYRAVNAKFSYDNDLRDILLGTGDAILVEDSDKDDYWGIYKSPKDTHEPGLNMLGVTLMHVRHEIRKEETKKKKVIQPIIKVEKKESSFLERALKTLKDKLVDLANSLGGKKVKKKIVGTFPVVKVSNGTEFLYYIAQQNRYVPKDYYMNFDDTTKTKILKYLPEDVHEALAAILNKKITKSFPDKKERKEIVRHYLVESFLSELQASSAKSINTENIVTAITKLKPATAQEVADNKKYEISRERWEAVSAYAKIEALSGRYQWD